MIKSNILQDLTNTQEFNIKDLIKRVNQNKDILKHQCKNLIEMTSMNQEITDQKINTKKGKKSSKTPNMKANMIKVEEMMNEKPTRMTMIDIQSLIQSNTDLNILKSSITLQERQKITQMIDDHMKNQEKSKAVMIKSADNIERNLMITQKKLPDTVKITDPKKIIAIKINPNTEIITGMTQNIATNPDIELMKGQKNYLQKKFPYKVVNRHKRKNHPQQIKQWMFNNSIDTWFRIL